MATVWKTHAELVEFESRFGKSKTDALVAAAKGWQPLIGLWVDDALWNVPDALADGSGFSREKKENPLGTRVVKLSREEILAEHERLKSLGIVGYFDVVTNGVVPDAEGFYKLSGERHARISEWKAQIIAHPLDPPTPRYQADFIGPIYRPPNVPCDGCAKRQAVLNAAIPGLGDAVAVVAQPIAKLLDRFFGTKFTTKGSGRFCYWSIGDGQYAEMVQACVASARAVGVTEDFHVWTDREIQGAVTHPCGNFDKALYLFKLEFLRREVAKLDYDYFIFLDADTFFVRHPGDFLDGLLADGKGGLNPVFVQMENPVNSPKRHRAKWWEMEADKYVDIVRSMARRELPTVYNTNAGFWIVRKDAVEAFYALCMEFWGAVKQQMGVSLTEEAPMAFVGHVLQANPDDKTLAKTGGLWVTDWTKHFGAGVPTEEAWRTEDYMTGEKIDVNPAIVHALHNDEHLLIFGRAVEAGSRPRA